MLTAGRDGSICELDILTSEFTRIAHNSNPITCSAYDEQSGFLWYGTGSSTFSCFKVPEMGNDVRQMASGQGNRQTEKQVQKLFGVEGESKGAPAVEGLVRKSDVFKFPGKYKLLLS